MPRRRPTRIARLRLETLEPRLTLAASPAVAISEFMAANDTTLADEDGDYPDWIELHNTTPEPLSLDGWYLTDNDGNLTKWQIPNDTLAADGYLVVFASSKDRRDPGSTLHTSFRLDADGEFLALVQPDGLTIEHSYPAIPLQPDVSYGIGEGLLTDTLIDTGASAKFLVPTATNPVGDWRAVGFDDSSWATVATGIGYQNVAGGTAVPIGYWTFDDTPNDLSGNDSTATLIGAATYSTEVPSQIGAGKSLSLTGAIGTYAVVSPMDVSETALSVSFWFKGPSTNRGLFTVAQGNLGSGGNDRALYLSGSNIAAQLKPGVTAETIASTGKNYADNTWHHLVYSFAQGVSTQRIYVDGVQVAAGGQSFSINAAQDRIYIGYAPQALSDYWNGWIDDVAIFTGLLTPSQITALYSGASPLELTSYAADIATNVGGSMSGANATSYLRIPFSVLDLSIYDGLSLKVKYDDGFAAYLNGAEVASRNAPAMLAWDSAATKVHSNAQATVFEDIDVSAALGSLRLGSNVLAIQGLNVTTSNVDFLLSPKLVDEDLTAIMEQYYTSPTPGGPNDLSGAELVADPLFSQSSSIITATTPITLSTSTPGAVIRYTTNGSVPNATSPLYTGPINVTTTTQIRARAFKSGARPSKVVSQFFTMVAADALPFSSNLPVIVIDTYAAAFDHTTLKPVTAHFLEDPGHRTTLTGRQDLAVRAGMRFRSKEWEKHNYLFESWDEGNNDAEYSIFGMPEESDWILYSPYNDKSDIRNALVYELNREIDKYAVRTRYVEVFLNTDGAATSADYLGLYVLMEKIKVDENRVDIAPMGPNDNSGADVTGGYLFSLDKDDPGITDWITTSRGNHFHMLEPDLATEATTEQRDYLINYLNGLENALYGPNFADSAGGYAAYVDAQTFVNYSLLVEITKNADNGYRLSTYYHKDRNGKIKIGPVWDFDTSLGNLNYLTGWDPVGWHLPQVEGTYTPYFGRLFEDPNFMQRYIDTYFQYRSDLWSSDRLMEKVDDHVERIYEAALRDHARWRTLGTYVWPNAYFGIGDGPQSLPGNIHPARTYRDEVQYLRQWLHDRLLWMDREFLPKPVLSQNGGEITPGFPLTITGNPAVGTLYYTTDGADPRASGGGLSPSAIAYTGPITLNANTKVIARLKHNNPLASDTILECQTDSNPCGDWSAPTTGVFVVDAPDLILSEIMYNPAAPGPTPSGYTRDDFEFVEVQNVGSTALNVNGNKFTKGISFTFPNVTIPAGEARVIVRNPAAFALRYPGVTPIGTFTGTLDNGGEDIALVDNVGVTLFDGKYEDDWEPHTDGDGFALVTTYEMPGGGALYSVGDASDKWRASQFINGTPGTADTGVQSGSIVINELVANGADWIELYNKSSGPIDLGGWYLSDDSTNLTKYRIAAGTTIPAGGFIVFTHADDYGNPADPGATVPFELSAFGGSVFLTSPGTGGMPGGYRASEDYGASDVGVSQGRYIKSNGKKDFVILSRATPGSANTGYSRDDVVAIAGGLGMTSGATQADGDYNGDGRVDLADLAFVQSQYSESGAAPVVGPVVISEIMYHPAENVLWLPVGTIKDEYVEIRNISGSPVSLFDPANPANTWKLTDGVEFTLPAGQTLAAGARALIVPINPATFRTKYSIPAAVPIYGPYTGNLDDGGEQIEISRPGVPSGGDVPYIRVDRIQFDDDAPWSKAADGDGPSLARIDDAAYGNDLANWAAGRAGGTPGAANTFIDLTPPDEVLTVTVTKTGVGTTDPRTNVTWTPVNDPESGVAYYNIYRKGSETVAGKAQPILIGASTTTAFLDNTVVQGPAFLYQVSAVNRDGVEGPRSPFDATYPIAVADSYIVAQNTALVTVNTPDTPLILLPARSVWKYKDDGSNQGTAWRAVAFDDSAWASGPAQLGYGEGDEATAVSCGHLPPCTASNAATTYFHSTFNATNGVEYTSAKLSVKFDDGVSLYINGVEVVRDVFNPLGTLGDNSILYNTYTFLVSGDDGQTFHDYAISPAVFVNGTNTIAVEIHQNNATSADISFDLALEVTRRRTGLLANDSDPEEDRLSAVQVTNPSHGQITQFNTDGTFTYVPDPDFTGTDSFTYKARDPQFHESLVTTVTISVNGPPPSPAPTAGAPGTAPVLRATGYRRAGIPRLDAAALDEIWAIG